MSVLAIWRMACPTVNKVGLYPVLTVSLVPKVATAHIVTEYAPLFSRANPNQAEKDDDGIPFGLKDYL